MSSDFNSDDFNSIDFLTDNIEGVYDGTVVSKVEIQGNVNKGTYKGTIEDKEILGSV